MPEGASVALSGAGGKLVELEGCWTALALPWELSASMLGRSTVTDAAGADWRRGSAAGGGVAGVLVGAESACSALGDAAVLAGRAVVAGRVALFARSCAGGVVAAESPRGWRAVGAGATGAGLSARRVTVPLRLKLRSSGAPTVSVAVELPVGAGVLVCWARAEAGASISAPASNRPPKRVTALICSRSTR